MGYRKKSIIALFFFFSFFNSNGLSSSNVFNEGFAQQNIDIGDEEFVQKMRIVCSEIIVHSEKLERLHLNRVNDLIDRLNDYLVSLMISSVGLLIFWKLWSISGNLELLARPYR